jgi:hypothetical protein
VRGRVGITHALEEAAGERVEQDAGPYGIKAHRASLPGRVPRPRSSLTTPPAKAYSVRLADLLDKTRWFGAFDKESKNGSSRSRSGEAQWNVCFVTRESV